MKAYCVFFRLILLLIFLCGCSNNNIMPLFGTYICEQLPFDTMVFDTDGNFSYYYQDSKQIFRRDNGTYEFENENTYLISSQLFTKTKAVCTKSGFTIVIGDVEYQFVREDEKPVVIDIPAQHIDS